MNKKSELNPLAAALGTILATSAFIIPTVSADENPFQITELTSGYMMAEKEGKCGEGKCGGMKSKCGMKMMKKMDSDQDGAISKEEFMQHHEKKFSNKDLNSDGKLTRDEIKMMKEGKGGGMKMKEGKCGEGKCGEKMKSEDKNDS
jgi:uncharacterized low-complexity protein